jgi:demethylmenaquinone methyltransferase/2-methoxy-6-polyprenyl-1,4-benzoquinol methylase
MGSDDRSISRVTRSKTQARTSYDKMSTYYDVFAGGSEKKISTAALKLLDLQIGESVLEIGFGTGHNLLLMAKAVGEKGKVFGIDLSAGMLQVSKKRLEKANYINRVELICDDALNLPYPDDKFDAVFTSFTLELFDSPEIPLVLNEIKRVLKPGGRIGVVSMAKSERATKIVKLYEWLHLKFPRYIDCRPIFVIEAVNTAEFTIKYQERFDLFGLPVELVIGIKPAFPVQS